MPIHIYLNNGKYVTIDPGQLRDADAFMLARQISECALVHQTTFLHRAYRDGAEV